MAGLVRGSIVIDDTGAKHSLQKPRKSQRGGVPLHVLKIRRLMPASRACPVATLESYLNVSDQLRTEGHSQLLFIGLRHPHHSIEPSSVSRWLNSTLEEAGIDTSVYSAHSTRGASASKAAGSGVSVESILKTGSWNSESTFTNFYRREIDPASEPSALVVDH